MTAWMQSAFLAVSSALIQAADPPASSRSAAPPPLADSSHDRLSPPSDGDHSFSTLYSYQSRLLALHGGDYRHVSLDVKAEHFEWMVWQYHMAPWHQVHTRVRLPWRLRDPIDFRPGADLSTWNGALLAALSYKYAVTRDDETLRRIEELLAGLHFFQEVTGKPGLAARCVVQSDVPVDECKHRYIAPDGTVYHFRASPAKGTYNQLVLGYATLLMRAGELLPPETERLAREDLAALALHLIDHDYHIRDLDGDKSPYGDLTPNIGPTGVPFNAQVATMIVAAGHSFPTENDRKRRRIDHEFERLREGHYYYERPYLHVIDPQKIGGGPFLKGMNDRNHVTNAAFIGLALEVDRARRRDRKVNNEFLYQLGQTMVESMNYLAPYHNSLCNFMWAGVLSDRDVFRAIIRDDRGDTRREVERLVSDGVEQLRRFPLDRFLYAGHELAAARPPWADEQRPDSYLWKDTPDSVWQNTGPTDGSMISAIDYLHAYWLMRFFRLDEHRAVNASHGDVLRLSTPSRTSTGGQRKTDD